MVNDNLMVLVRGGGIRGGRRLEEAGVNFGQLIPSVSDEGMPAHLARTHRGRGMRGQRGEWEGQRTVNIVPSHNMRTNGSHSRYIKVL